MKKKRGVAVPDDNPENFHEMPSSACDSCQFLSADRGCVVPGGACVVRSITGTDQYVGDVLERLGLISTGWWV